MQTTKIYRLPYQKPEFFEKLKAAQMESAKVWNECMEAHKKCRKSQTAWLNQTQLQKQTKGKYELNCPNPECSYRNKHRDITGSLMMQVLAYGEKPKYPEQIKYLRPVNIGSSRCADTRQCSLILANISSTSSEGDRLISAQSISVV